MPSFPVRECTPIEASCSGSPSGTRTRRTYTGPAVPTTTPDAATLLSLQSTLRVYNPSFSSNYAPLPFPQAQRELPVETPVRVSFQSGGSTVTELRGGMRYGYGADHGVSDRDLGIENFRAFQRLAEVLVAQGGGRLVLEARPQLDSQGRPVLDSQGRPVPLPVLWVGPLPIGEGVEFVVNGLLKVPDAVLKDECFYAVWDAAVRLDTGEVLVTKADSTHFTVVFPDAGALTVGDRVPVRLRARVG